jgi:hypothetical protein
VDIDHKNNHQCSIAHSTPQPTVPAQSMDNQISHELSSLLLNYLFLTILKIGHDLHKGTGKAKVWEEVWKKKGIAKG